MLKSKKDAGANGKLEAGAKVFVPPFLRDAALARLDDSIARKDYPTLYACLTAVYDGPTLIRQAGKLTVRPVGAHWEVSIECPGERLVARIVLLTLIGLLENVELALSSGSLQWSPGWSKDKKRLPSVDDLVQ